MEEDNITIEAGERAALSAEEDARMSLYDEYMPRKPTLDEIAEVKGAVMEAYNLDADEADYVESAYIAVYDHYQTDSPGYCGKVAVALFGGTPSSIESFVWVDGKCTSVR